MFIGSKDTIQEISTAYDISKNHLMKVTYELGKLVSLKPFVEEEVEYGSL
jgi:hypothetical protein